MALEYYPFLLVAAVAFPFNDTTAVPATNVIIQSRLDATKQFGFDASTNVPTGTLLTGILPPGNVISAGLAAFTFAGLELDQTFSGNNVFTNFVSLRNSNHGVGQQLIITNADSAGNSGIDFVHPATATISGQIFVGGSGSLYPGAFLVGTPNVAQLGFVQGNVIQMFIDGTTVMSALPVVPNATGSLSIGTTSKYWNAAYVNSIFTSGETFSNAGGDSHNTFFIQGGNDILSISSTSLSGSATGTYLVLKTASAGSGTGLAAIQIAPDRSTAFYNYIFPSSTNVWDIGASGFNWRNLYVNTIFLAGGANNQGLIQENTGNLLIGTGSTTGSGNATSITFGTAPAGVGTQTALTLNSDQSATFYGSIFQSIDNTWDIGATGTRPATIYTHNLNISGTCTGCSAADMMTTDTVQTVTGLKAWSTNLLPSATNTYDLGSTSFVWNNAYIKTLTTSAVVSTGNAGFFSRTVTIAGLAAPSSAITIGLGVSGAGTVIAGGGPSMLFFAPDSTNAQSFLGRVSAVWENPTVGSETASVVFNVRANSGDTFALTEVMRLKANGNVLIGTTTDTGQKLQVNGISKLNDFVTMNNNSHGSGQQVLITNADSVGNSGIDFVHPATSTISGQIFMGGSGSLYPGAFLVGTPNVAQLGLVQNNTIQMFIDGTTIQAGLPVVPSVTGTQSLGTTSKYWNAGYVNSIFTSAANFSNASGDSHNTFFIQGGTDASISSTSSSGAAVGTYLY